MPNLQGKVRIANAMNLIMGISWCGGLPFFFCAICALLLPSTNVAWGDSAESENFETKYQTALDLISHSKSNRDFRRGVSILEDLSVGVGRTSADSLAELSTLYLAGNRQGFQIYRKLHNTHRDQHRWEVRKGAICMHSS